MLVSLCSLLAAASPSPSTDISQPIEAPASKQRPVLGGARSADASSAEVRAAAAAAAESVDATVADVSDATTQVVAGTIYRFSFTTTDGRSYDAEVFRALNGEYSVRSIEETGDTGSNEAEGDDEG